MAYSTEKKHPPKINHFLLPLIIVLTIIPLIVHQYDFDNEFVNVTWFTKQDSFTDFFLYYKSILLTITGFVIALILVYQHLMDKRIPKLQIWVFPLAIYTGLILLSAVYSEHPSTVWNGSYELFESTWVLVTYTLLLLYAYINVRTENDLKLLFKCLSIGIIIITMIGIFQSFGLDIFRTTLGKKLITKRAVWEQLENFTFTFSKKRVYSTLFNPNYVGVYSSLLFPITIGYTLLCDKKKPKILAALLSILLVVCTFGAQSKTGLLILVLTSIILFVILHKQLFKNMKLIILGVLIIVGAFLGINKLQNNAYMNNIMNAFLTKEATKTLTKIETADDYIKFIYNDKEIFLSCVKQDDGNLICELKDKDGNIYDNNYDAINVAYTLTDPIFNNFTVTPVYLDDQGTLGCEVNIDNNLWYFKINEENTGYRYVNKFNQLDICSDPPKAVFENHGTLFTGRGYIWSRTIPLLKDNMLIGTGPDTFTYYFPQSDYVGKYNYGFGNSVITKPHNLYLQIATQTGVLSLLAVIVLYIMYLIDCYKAYHKSSYSTFTEQMGVLILVGTLGYMISGMINDSTITVAPLFWTLLGVGFACNRMVKESVERHRRLMNEDKITNINKNNH